MELRTDLESPNPVLGQGTPHDLELIPDQGLIPCLLARINVGRKGLVPET
jgi:hypothetical protein